MSESQPVELIVYGDFNCPFSALASARVSRLERIGAVHVDWRAVEHAPDLPPAGIEIAGELASELQRELEQIRGLLSADEPDRLTLPRPSTQHPAGDRRVRRHTHRRSPSDARPPVRGPLERGRRSHRRHDSGTARRDDHRHGNRRPMARGVEALTDPIVPVMVLPDGYVSRGLGALARLAKLAHDTNTSGAGTPDTSRPPITDHHDQGGESPCFAHLLDEPLD